MAAIFSERCSQTTPILIAGPERPRERQPSSHAPSHPAQVGSSQFGPNSQSSTRVGSTQFDSKRSRQSSPRVSSTQFDSACQSSPGTGSSQLYSERPRQSSSFAGKFSPAPGEVFSAEIAADSSPNKVGWREGKRKETKEKVRVWFCESCQVNSFSFKVS